MKYVCVEDWQKGGWCVGTVNTAEGWRRLALNWADSDQNEWAIKELKALYHQDANKIIEFISDYWELKIIEERNWK